MSAEHNSSIISGLCLALACNIKHALRQLNIIRLMLAEQCEKGMKAILGFAALEQKTTMHSQNQSYLIGYDTIACNKHRLEIKAESLENL